MYVFVCVYYRELRSISLIHFFTLLSMFKVVINIVIL